MNQVLPIRQFAQARGFELVAEYTDKGISGAKERRPGLDQLVLDARRGRYKVLIVAGIDRLARDTRHLLNLIHELAGYGVAVISLRESLDFTTPMGQATLTILGAIAQLERELIRERIRNALAAKKLAAAQAGTTWTCGRPRKVSEAMTLEVRRLRDQGLSIRKIGAALGISKASVQRALGVPKTSFSGVKKDE